MKTFPLLAALCFALGFVVTAQAKNATEPVVASYIAALGRFPTSEELKYWQDVPKQSLERLISNHIMWAADASRRNAYREVVVNSYCTVFGRAPTSSEIGYWMNRMPRPFRDLVNAHIEFLGENREARDEMIKRSLRVVFGANPNPVILNHWDEQLTVPFVKLIASHLAWKNSGQPFPSTEKEFVMPAVPAAVLIANTRQIIAIGDPALLALSGGKLSAPPLSCDEEAVISFVLSANAEGLVTDGGER